MHQRLRMIGDQRYDLPLHERMLTNIEDEFQIYNRHFISSGNGIVKNWVIENAGGLEVRVNVSTDSLLFINENTGEENIVLRDTLADILTLDIADNSVNYVEVEIFKTTSSNEIVALWDAIANSQEGEEFSQTSDTCTKLQARLVSNTIAPTGDSNKILLATVTTSAGAITDIVDNREFFWHSDGDWDFGLVRTDTTITTLQEAYYGITASIKEMKNTPNWYDSQGIGTLGLLERSNYMLVDGGDINWERVSAEQLGWSADLKLLAPNQAFNYAIEAQDVNGVLDGEIVYVTLPDEGVAPTGYLTVSKTTDGSYLIDPDNTRNFILAYRSGTKVYFGNGWQNVELESGEESQLGDGINNALLIAGGLTDEMDSTPPYTSTFVVTPGTSWTNAISELDSAVQDIFALINGNIYTEVVTMAVGTFLNTTEVTLPSAFSYELGKNSLEVYYDGRFMCIGDDYLEVDDGGGIGTKIALTYDRPGEVKIKFRVQIGGDAAPSGGGGSDLGVKEEGVVVDNAVTEINYTGLGKTVTQTASGKIVINIPGLAAGPSALPPSLNRQNSSGVTIPIGRLVYLETDDTIAMTDADDVAKGTAIGITAAEITDTSLGDFYSLGWVIPGVLDGLSILPGQMVYMSETTGLMVGETNPDLPDDITDVLYKIGVATNLVSGEAKDLIMQAEREFN